MTQYSGYTFTISREFPQLNNRLSVSALEESFSESVWTGDVVFPTWSDGPLVTVLKNCLANPLIIFFTPNTNVNITKEKSKRQNDNDKTTIIIGHLNHESAQNNKGKITYIHSYPKERIFCCWKEENFTQVSIISMKANNTWPETSHII